MEESFLPSSTSLYIQLQSSLCLRSFSFFLNVFIYLAALDLSFSTQDLCCGALTLQLWQAGLPTRDGTPTPLYYNMASSPLDHQGSPRFLSLIIGSLEV